MSWNLKGTHFENCNCNSVCPCTTSALTQPGDHERCHVTFAIHIDSGAIDDHDVSGRDPAQEEYALRGVRSLTSGEDEADGLAPGVSHHMDLGAQSCSRTPQSLVLAPPFHTPPAGGPEQSSNRS